MNKENFVYVVIFTFVIAFAFVFLLSLANNATAVQVAENQKLVIAGAFLNAAGVDIQEDEDPLEVFSQTFPQAQGEEEELRSVVNGKELIVRRFSGQGLWGTITGVLAVNSELTHIQGLDIISHAETPGLGGRIEEDWFKKQFSGEVILPEGLTIRKGEGSVDEDPANGVVDGITGASLTSSAMGNIINKEIQLLKERRTSAP